MAGRKNPAFFERDIMVTVTPLKNFDHNGRRNKGESFEVSEGTAKALERAKLVVIGHHTIINPYKPGGAQRSASLPGRVSDRKMFENLRKLEKSLEATALAIEKAKKIKIPE